jgi:indolepyruvate ferredoxin oxidoreductase, beta subunit
MKDRINFLLAGVGGQGTILASDVLVGVGLAAGYQAKQAEIHGMSQRGGSVTSHVRWGPVVHSPMAGAGEVDALLAFERVEALRNLNQLHPEALVLVNLETIKPISVSSGGQLYPDDGHLRSTVARVTQRAVFVDGPAIAQSLGNNKVANVVLLGVLSAMLETESLVGTNLNADTWLKVITERVPARFADLNRQAFLAGRQVVVAAG